MPGVRIRILDVPPGEAPLEVRRRWVGLELPLVPGDTGPVRMLAQGVVTGPRRKPGKWLCLWYRLTGRVFEREGYRVPALQALEALEPVAPDAAAWWRTNTPHLFERTPTSVQVLIFDAHVCALITGS